MSFRENKFLFGSLSKRLGTLLVCAALTVYLAAVILIYPFYCFDLCRFTEEKLNKVGEYK